MEDLKMIDNLKRNREIAIQMLNKLGSEHIDDGFSDYPLFAEDTLEELVGILNNKQLDWLMDRIEETSQTGVNRNKI